MSRNYVKIAKDKADLFQQLCDKNAAAGLFETHADLMAFAGALGLRYNQRIPLTNISKEPSPIDINIFISRGYETLIKLIAMTEIKDINILTNEPEMEEQRILFFEEYANGGLEILRQELKGIVDYTEQILLMMTNERGEQESSSSDFDLTKFLI